MRSSVDARRLAGAAGLAAGCLVPAAAGANVIGIREVPVPHLIPASGGTYTTGAFVNMVGGGSISTLDGQDVVQGNVTGRITLSSRISGGGGTSSGGLGGFGLREPVPRSVAGVFIEARADADGLITRMGGGAPYPGPGGDYFEQLEMELTIRGRARIVSQRDDAVAAVGIGGYVEIPYQIVYPAGAIVEIAPVGGPWLVVDGPVPDSGVSMRVTHRSFVWDNTVLSSAIPGATWDPDDLSDLGLSPSAVPLVSQLWRFRADEASITATLTGQGEVEHVAEQTVRVRVTVPEPTGALVGLGLASLVLRRRVRR